MPPSLRFRPGPHAAMQLLDLFYARHLTLSEAQFDACFDALTEFLEKVNDEKYRITHEGEKEEDDL